MASRHYDPMKRQISPDFRISNSEDLLSVFSNSMIFTNYHRRNARLAEKVTPRVDSARDDAFPVILDYEGTARTTVQISESHVVLPAGPRFPLFAAVLRGVVQA